MSLLFSLANLAIIFRVSSVSSKRRITSFSAFSRLIRLLSIFGSCCPFTSSAFWMIFSSSCYCCPRISSEFFGLAVGFFSALFFLFLCFPAPRIMFMICTVHPSPTPEFLSSSLQGSTRSSHVTYMSCLPKQELFGIRPTMSLTLSPSANSIVPIVAPSTLTKNLDHPSALAVFLLSSETSSSVFSSSVQPNVSQFRREFQ